MFLIKSVLCIVAALVSLSGLVTELQLPNPKTSDALWNAVMVSAVQFQ